MRWKCSDEHWRGENPIIRMNFRLGQWLFLAKRWGRGVWGGRTKREAGRTIWSIESFIYIIIGCSALWVNVDVSNILRAVLAALFFIPQSTRGSCIQSRKFFRAHPRGIELERFDIELRTISSSVHKKRIFFSFPIVAFSLPLRQSLSLPLSGSFNFFFVLSHFDFPPSTRQPTAHRDDGQRCRWIDKNNFTLDKSRVVRACIDPAMI